MPKRTLLLLALKINSSRISGSRGSLLLKECVQLSLKTIILVSGRSGDFPCLSMSFLHFLEVSSQFLKLITYLVARLVSNRVLAPIVRQFGTLLFDAFFELGSLPVEVVLDEALE